MPEYSPPAYSLSLECERLRDDLQSLKMDVRGNYETTQQVSRKSIKNDAARLAELWLIRIGPNALTQRVVEPQVIADLTVQFQRLLTASEKAALRSTYESVIRSILAGFTQNVALPIKAHEANGEAAAVVNEPDQRDHADNNIGNVQSAFVAHSFAAHDKFIVEAVSELLREIGLNVQSGVKPKADLISNKVKERIDGCELFVAIFTRADKIARKREWTTSNWVVDEKAYAVGKRKRLILLKEDLVQSIGGLQGDYEFIEFERARIDILLLRVLSLFRLHNNGLK